MKFVSNLWLFDSLGFQMRNMVAAVGSLGLAQPLSALVQSKYITAAANGSLVYSKSEKTVIKTQSGVPVPISIFQRLC